MSDELLVRHCSPTLAGLKTGNLFACPFDDIAELLGAVRRWNRLLGKKGLRMIPLRVEEKRALIYLYRPGRLARDLQQDTARQLLQRYGYGTQTPVRCVSLLRNRLGKGGEFPHEIGLFLGYPPEDVQGFIENKPNSCKSVGFWKVYGDVQKAQKTFARYQKCTKIYCDCHASGRSVERLAVAER